MTCIEKHHKRGDNANRYATGDDFFRVFSEELERLYQLSYLLIGDHDKAESCFLAGLEDCYRTTHVFREWALFWARCTIIRHAKRKLRPRPHRDSASSAEPVLRYSGKPADLRGSYFKVEAVLSLGDFDRFVFVMSVLERYSDRDCALLLGCSVLEIRRARIEASLHIAGSPARSAVGMLCPLDRGSHSSPELKGLSAGSNAPSSAGASPSVTASTATWTEQISHFRARL